MKEELESGLQKLENSLSEVICLEKEECKRASEVKQSVTDSIENFIHLLKEVWIMAINFKTNKGTYIKH